MRFGVLNSVFRYRLPDVYDEWIGQFYLEFQPEYPVPEYLCMPMAAVLVADVHVDILDFITEPSCHSNSEEQTQTFQRYPLTEELTAAQINSMLCICEIWLSPTSHCDLEEVAAKLVPALLFENISPASSNRIAGIMVSAHTAEFSVVVGTPPDRTIDSVTLMCIPVDSSHILLRIRSTDRVTYAAVVVALARRLKLLLSKWSDTDTDLHASGTPSEYGSFAALDKLHGKYKTVVYDKSQPQQNDGPPYSYSSSPFESIDCVTITNVAFPSNIANTC